MAHPNKLTIFAVLVAVAAVAGVASAEKAGGFVVTGRVYCDPCRAGFETNVSRSVPGAYQLIYICMSECRERKECMNA